MNPERHDRLHIMDRLPAGFLDCPVNKLDSLFEGPTLIRLRGECHPPLFVATLLHGNEVSGLLGLQILLKQRHELGEPLPRDLWLFIGNIEAARFGVRRLPGQPDYNRIWAGGEAPECRMAQQLLSLLDEQPLFAGLDIHNNSGRNPIYGCVNVLEPTTLNLAQRFSDRLVYFTEPHQVLGMALSRRCPAATLECGTSGLPEGINRIVRLIDGLLTEEPLSDACSPGEPPQVFHTVARVTVSEGDRVGFGYQPLHYNLFFPHELEALNFRMLPAGTFVGWRADGARLKVHDNDGRDVADDYLEHVGDRIRIRRPCVLSMLTSDITVIHQDCLCYIMEPWPLRQRR